MPPTGDTSERAGIYRAPCCDEEIELQRGERFPACKRCYQSATWTFIRPIDIRKTAVLEAGRGEKPHL